MCADRKALRVGSWLCLGLALPTAHVLPAQHAPPARAAPATPGQVAPKVAPGAGTPAARALQRARDDAIASCLNVLDTPHAFAGSCRYVAGRRQPPTDTEDILFRGAWNDGLELLQIRDHRVLTHGDRQLVAVGDGAWTLPQGDAPDCPFSPISLAKCLGLATIDAWETTSHGDRPAIRVHAFWTGDEAAHLVGETSHPSPQAQAVLERFPRMLSAQPADRMRVDATICFDPATRSLYAAALRLCVLDTRDLPEGEATPPDGTGLPPLPRRPLVEYAFAVTVVDARELPMPDLDDAMRGHLGWPPKTSPALKRD